MDPYDDGRIERGVLILCYGLVFISTIGYRISGLVRRGLSCVREQELRATPIVLKLLSSTIGCGIYKS